MLAPEADVEMSGSHSHRPALADAGRRYRLVLIVSASVGLTGLIVLSVLGYPVAGIALCAGMFMGFINSRMVIAQAAKFTQMKFTQTEFTQTEFTQTEITQTEITQTEHPNKRALVFGVLQRLGAVTAIALLIAFAFRPQGFTVFIGLAVFQLLMMGSTAGAMVRELRG